jgi:hypothetical protein
MFIVCQMKDLSYVRRNWNFTANTITYCFLINKKYGTSMIILNIVTESQCLHQVWHG